MEFRDYENSWRVPNYDPTEPEDKPEDYGKTQPGPAGASGTFQDYGTTEPFYADTGTNTAGGGSAFADYGPTEASGYSYNVQPRPQGTPAGVVDYDRMPERAGTVENFDTDGFIDRRPMNDYPLTGRRPGPYNVTEPAGNEQRYGFMPVVGWLVCIEGPDKGRDFRIHDGYNSIGRAPSMDICISGDKKISRERDARIAYDPEERKFFFAPDDGKNLVKLNGKTLMNGAELNPYDTLTIGSCKLMFVPFCGDQFSWLSEA